jgi:hypothetical protein
MTDWKTTFSTFTGILVGDELVMAWSEYIYRFLIAME